MLAFLDTARSATLAFSELVVWAEFKLPTDNIVGLSAAIVVGLIVLALAIVFAAGIFQARSLLKREFSAYFLSPIAYVVLVLFLAVTGHLFYLAMGQLT